MKPNRPKTIEKNLIEIILAIMLFIAIGYSVKCANDCFNELKNRPTIKDLHQRQEMIDYQTSQGRTNVILF